MEQAASEETPVQPTDAQNTEESLTLRIRYRLNRSFSTAQNGSTPPSEKIIEQRVVSGQLVQELIQVLMDRCETCHKTCFLLRFPDSTPLEHFTEISSFKQLKDSKDIVIDMTDEPYLSRDIRAHILHVNEVIWSAVRGEDDVYNGFTGCSPCYVPFALNDSNDAGKIVEADMLPDQKVSMSLQSLFYRSRNRPKSDQASISPDTPLPARISYSGWNPPSANRRLAGDLAYLSIQTNPWTSKVSNRVLHVTACSRGFFLNQCTLETFNPAAANGRIYHSIVDLLIVQCPEFRKQWKRILEFRANINPLIRLPVSPIPPFSWVCPKPRPLFDQMRANCCELTPILQFTDLSAALCSPVGQNRDWNEELQASRELPSETVSQQLTYDRTTYRVACDFVGAAMRCAKCAVEGQLPSINPSDLISQQMFIHNNMFLSFGFDVRDHYANHGGNEAAHVAAKKDIRGIQMVEDMAWAEKHENFPFCTVGTILVDYLGFRVTVQSIIPGILDKEQEKSVMYGSINFGKSFVSNDEIAGKLSAIADKLKMAEHEIRADGLDLVKVRVPVEWKAIKGNDGRLYILDLIRTTPPDYNWLRPNPNFPVEQYPHKLASVRMEYYESLLARPDCQHYNFNSLQPSVEFTEQSESLDVKIGEIASEIVEHLIPSFVKAIQLSYTSTDPSSSMLLVPLDGEQLTDTMHAFGINMRYLGQLIQSIDRLLENCSKDETNQIESIKTGNNVLVHLRSLAVSEIWARSVKHLFRSLMTSGLANIEQVVGFFNCALSTTEHKRTKKPKSPPNLPDFLHTTASFYRQLAKTAKIRFNSAELDHLGSFGQLCAEKAVCLEFGCGLRRLCHLTGLQLFSHYQLESPFTADDIAGFSPRLKSKPTKSHTLDRVHNLINEARKAVSECRFRPAFEAITCAHVILSSVYGPLNDEVAICLRMSARLNFVLGETIEAIILQYRATLVIERINGVESPSCVRDYCHLAHYCFAAAAYKLLEKGKDDLVESETGMPNLNDKSSLLRAAIKYMTRARYLACLTGGQSLYNPKLVSIEANLALMLQAYDTACGGGELGSFACSYADSALKRSETLFGPVSSQTALIHQIKAQVCLCQLNFHDAVQLQKQSARIYESIHGQENYLTEQASAKMKTMIEQGVLYKKQIKQIYGDKAMTKILLSGKQVAANFLNRTLITHTILDIMNTLNGFMTFKNNEIIFIKYPNANGQDANEAGGEKNEAENANECQQSVVDESNVEEEKHEEIVVVAAQ